MVGSSIADPTPRVTGMLTIGFAMSLLFSFRSASYDPIVRLEALNVTVWSSSSLGSSSPCAGATESHCVMPSPVRIPLMFQLRSRVETVQPAPGLIKCPLGLAGPASAPTGKIPPAF